MSRFSDVTIKNLYAKSGNKCAFPGCNCDLTSEGINISQVAHIISEKVNGPRYDSNYVKYDCGENLILLCPNHHKIIDSEEGKYTVACLRVMKAEHEKYIKLRVDSNDINKKVINNFLEVIHRNNIKHYIEKNDFTSPFPTDVLEDIDCSILGFEELLNEVDILQCKSEIESDIKEFQLILQKIIEHVGINGQVSDDGNTFRPISCKIDREMLVSLRQRMAKIYT